MSYEGPELPITPAARPRPRFALYAVGCAGMAAFLLIGLMSLLNTLNKVATEIVIDKKADLNLLATSHIPIYPGATYDETTIRQIRAATLWAAKSKGVQTDKPVIALQIPADEKTARDWYEKKLTEVGYKRTDKTITIPFGGKKVEQVIYARGVQRLAMQVIPDSEFPGKSIVTFSVMAFAEPGRTDV
jgi:hypothetical protein